MNAYCNPDREISWLDCLFSINLSSNDFSALNFFCAADVKWIGNLFDKKDAL